MKKPFIVGITGGSGSGKTFFINQIMHNFAKEQICLISQDNYYRPIEQVPLDDRGIQNFDTIEAIDFERFRKDVSRIINGETISVEEYTFNNKNIVPRTFVLNPAPIIIIEGIFVFVSELINDVLDFKIFLDAKEEIKLKRRIVRDYHERGYDLDDVLYRYEHHVAPAYEKYIAPEKQRADLVIPNNKNIDRPIKVFTSYLKHEILEEF